MTTEEVWEAARKLLGPSAHIQYDAQAPTVADRQRERPELDRLRVALAQAVPGDVLGLRREVLACAYNLADAAPEEVEKRVRHLVHTVKEMRLQEKLAKERADLALQVKRLQTRLLGSQYKVGLMGQEPAPISRLFVIYGRGDSWEEALEAAAREKQSRDGGTS